MRAKVFVSKIHMSTRGSLSKHTPTMDGRQQTLGSIPLATKNTCTA